jgi:hypothetical protein
MRDDLAAKHSIWALRSRSHMLYAGCLSVHHDESISEHDKGQFAVEAWLESERIEKLLDMHTCDIEKANRRFSPLFVCQVLCRWSHHSVVYLGRQVLFEYARCSSLSLGLITNYTSLYSTKNLVTSQYTRYVPHPNMYVPICFSLGFTYALSFMQRRSSFPSGQGTAMA